MITKKVYNLVPEEKMKIIRAIELALEEKEEILFAYVHGSFRHGAFRDIDVGIFLDKPAESALKFELRLETQLSEEVKYPVDVRILNAAPLSFKFNVIKDGELLFDRDERMRSDFECHTFSAYHDFAPYRKRYLKEALGIEV